MKKILALVLALMLVFSTSIIAFADQEVTSNDGTSDSSVKVEIVPSTWTGDYTDVDPTGATYDIDIDLLEVTFKYTFGAYDSDNHTYANTGWDKTTADITVKNHSNTSIKVEAAFNGAVTANGVTASLTKASIAKIESAVGKAATDEATPKDTITVAIDGAVPTTTTGYQLTTVRLTITGLAK